MGRTEGDAPPEGVDGADVYQAAFDGMHQGLLVLGADGRISRANRRIASLLAVQPGALPGASLASFVHPADHASLATLLATRPGTSAQAQLRLLRSGEPVTSLVSVTGMADDRKVCLVSDLSQQKRHEAADERTRRFLATLAHELRNMLGPIRSAAEALKAVPGLDARCLEMIEVIDRQSSRMTALVEDLRRINPKE